MIIHTSNLTTYVSLARFLYTCQSQQLLREWTFMNISLTYWQTSFCIMFVLKKKLKHLACWKTVKSVLHTTDDKCHGKREKMMVRVKLHIPRVNFLHVEVLWDCFPICFSCLAPWSLARAPERRCFTVPTPVHRLHFLILPVETPRIGTTGDTDRQAAPCCGPSLDCIRLKEIMYTLCFLQ